VRLELRALEDRILELISETSRSGGRGIWGVRCRESRILRRAGLRALPRSRRRVAAACHNPRTSNRRARNRRWARRNLIWRGDRGVDVYIPRKKKQITQCFAGPWVPPALDSLKDRRTLDKSRG